MPITFSPEALQKIGQSTFPAVYNINNPSKVDRRMMPALSSFSDTKETIPLNQNTITVKYKIQSNIAAQGWENRDRLAFGEQDPFIDATFAASNVHHGIELLHDEVEAAVGGVIVPNQLPQSKALARADSKGERFRLLNYVQEQMESLSDIRNVNLDQMLLQSNSTNAKLPSGFDAYWPRATCTGMTTDSGGTRGYYNLGSIGGRLRSQYPDVFQHYLWLNATYTNGGSLRRAFNTARYEAQLRSRGRSKGGVKYVLAGRRAAEKLVLFAQNNNLQIWANADKAPNLDVGLPTDSLKFEGLPVHIVPTFAILDGVESQTYAWDDCLMLIDPTAFCWGFAAGKEAVFSTPPDEHDLRVTRFSLDDKFLLIPKVPNAISIVHLAA